MQSTALDCIGVNATGPEGFIQDLSCRVLWFVNIYKGTQPSQKEDWVKLT